MIIDIVLNQSHFIALSFVFIREFFSNYYTHVVKSQA